MPERFASNQDIYLEFNVPSTGYIQLSVSGKIYNGTGAVETYNYMRAASGFVYNGSNILKRNTTIGQSPSENMSSGSWIHGVHWYGNQIGLSSTSYHSWAAADTYGVCTYGTKTGVVKKSAV